MKKRYSRVLALMLAIVMLLGVLPVAAASPSAGNTIGYEKIGSGGNARSLLQEADKAEQQSLYADGDTVRVSIVMKQKPTIALYSAEDIADNAGAMRYRSGLENGQNTVIRQISQKLGEELNVVWQLTLAANIVSANVQYGQIDQIKAVAGVEDVVVERQYKPMVMDTKPAADPKMATASTMIGTAAVYSAGYYGAGSKIAVIDTGIDDDHQSFDAGAFEYSLQQHDTADAELMHSEAIADVFDKLNVSKMALDPENGGAVRATAENVYVSSKIPFAYNYVDQNLNINHDNDDQSEHGSHVAGIAAANDYIPDADGDGYASALEAAHMQGVAPDAQLIIMKVFGENGGAYDSDYMAAIEDALILGADAVNLSLGTSNAGNSTITGENSEVYSKIFANLQKSGAVVTIAAGNEGAWSDYTTTGSLYKEDVSRQTTGAPSTYTNSLSVASADNVGMTGGYFTFGDRIIVYREYAEEYDDEPLASLEGERDFVMIDGLGTSGDWEALEEAGIPLEGKILICKRGELNFSDKAMNAAIAGGAASIIYNNVPFEGALGLGLDDYFFSNPCVSISLEDAKAIQAGAEEHDPIEKTEFDYTIFEDVTTELHVWTGKINIADGVASAIGDAPYQMSDFSSWGVAGSLELKPEITAPGGNIYSVNGAVAGGTAYESMSGTSMAAPQAAGMAALVAQYIRDKGLTGLQTRRLSQSLLMSTAVPMKEAQEDGEGWYSVMKQGAGLANVGNAVSAKSYILMDDAATSGAADGKVKAELGDDPAKKGEYTFGFTIYNLTDEAQTYALSAELFTQGVVTADLGVDEPDNVDFLDTLTTPLDADVTWSTGSASAAVPAGGSMHLTVTLKLTDAQKAALNENYPNGAYVEGFVFAKQSDTAEGVKGTEHSIPILGFYGDWRDPSMFEVGTRTLYATGEETRATYVEDNTSANFVAVKYPGVKGSYYLGTNPLDETESYHPERIALSSGSTLERAGYMLIRNAAKGTLTLTDKNGTALYTKTIDDPEDLGAAFYYETFGFWMDDSKAVGMNWTLDDAEKFREGERYTLTLRMQTEYSAAAERVGSGKGETLSISFTLDSIAPEMTGDFAANADETAYTVQVEENQYLAYAALYDSDGALVSVLEIPEQTEAGAGVELSIDASELEKDAYTLELYDYAMNCTAYRLYHKTEPVGTAESIVMTPESAEIIKGGTKQLRAKVLPSWVTDGSVTWTSSDADIASVDENGLVSANAIGTCVITATSVLTPSVKGTCTINVVPIDRPLSGVFTDGGKTVWKNFTTGDLNALTTVTDTQIPNMVAYSECGDGYDYAADDGEDGSTLYRIDPETKEITTMGKAASLSSGESIHIRDLASLPCNDKLVAVGGQDMYIIYQNENVFMSVGHFPEEMIGIANIGSESSPWGSADVFRLIGASGTIYQQVVSYMEDEEEPGAGWFGCSYNPDPDEGNLEDCIVSEYEMPFTAANGSAYYDGELLFWAAYDEASARSQLFAADLNAEDGVKVYALDSFAENASPVHCLSQTIPGCAHANLEHVSAKAPTASKDGNREYWYCPDCGKYFSDAGCEHEVSWSDLVIPATGGVVIIPVRPSVRTDADKETKLPFTDVDKNTPYYDAIRYVYEEGLMNGIGKSQFAPTSTLTRAMVVTTLYRIENKPAVTKTGTFTDVAAGKWYTDAIEWAAANKIVDGYGNGLFGPNDAVTREQLAAILNRYVNFKGYRNEKRADLSTMADGGRVSAYAVDSVKWALAYQILITDDNRIRPAQSATRAEVAQALYALLENAAK